MPFDFPRLDSRISFIPPLELYEVEALYKKENLVQRLEEVRETYICIPNDRLRISFTLRVHAMRILR